jgi:hypothetical protein
MYVSFLRSEIDIISRVNWPPQEYRGSGLQTPQPYDYSQQLRDIGAVESTANAGGLWTKTGYRKVLFLGAVFRPS